MKKYIRPVLIVICLAVFCFSGYKLISALVEYEKADQFYDETANQYVTPVTPSVKPEPVVPPEQQTGSLIDETVTPPESETAPPAAEEPEAPTEYAPIQVDFDRLLEANQDVVGWLYCEDTVVNYPVVRGEDNNYYLHRLMDGTYSYSGTLFMDYRCEPDYSSGNTVIYGHNMNNGTMLHCLVNYDSQEYYEEHPVFYLLTPDQNYKLELFSGFVTTSDSWVYVYDFAGKEAKVGYIEQALEYSDFDAGITPTEDDRIVLLSTCTYDYTNARYVLLGVLTPIG